MYIEKGMTTKEIGLEYDRCGSTISKYMRHYGYKLRNNNDFKLFSDVDALALYEEYKEGASTVDLGKKYSTSPASINRQFTRLDLPLRSNKVNSKKFYCDSNYFKNIDTQDKAYWLGFIYADGYISKAKYGNVFGLSVAKKDKCLLEKLSKSIDSTYNINEYLSSGFSKSPYVRLTITDDKLCADLEKHGVFFNKTNILLHPKLDKCLIRHFIRGYFDGDGSVYVTKSDGQYHTSFMGTDEMLQWIGEFLLENKLINQINEFTKRKPHQTVSSLRFGGNNIAYRILSHLYSDSNLYLERKYKLYLQLQEIHHSRL